MSFSPKESHLFITQGAVGSGGVLEIRGLKLYINEIKGSEIWGEIRGLKIIRKKIRGLKIYS